MLSISLNTFLDMPGLYNLSLENRLNPIVGAEFADLEAVVFMFVLWKLKTSRIVLLGHEQSIRMMINSQPFPYFFPVGVVLPQAALILM